MGTKRKRPGSDPEEVIHDQAAERTSTTIQRELQARAAIDKGHTLLFRAFKTARGFERQKLGRRRKTAGTPDSKTASTEKAKPATNNDNDNDNDPSGSNAQAQAQPAGADAAVARIEAETAALKALDLTHVTTNYLIKSLLKFKEVAESPSLPGFFRRMAPVPKDAASLNVVARLCNSNPVREVLGGIVKETTAALGVRIHAAGKDKDKGKTKTKSKDQQSVAVDQIPGGTTGGDSDKEAEEDEFQGFEDELAASSDADSEADEATIQRRTSLLRAALTETPDDDDEGSQDTGPSSSDDDELSRANLLRSRRNLSTTPSGSTTPSPDRDLDPNEISDLEPDSDPDQGSDPATTLTADRRAAKRRQAPPAAASLTSTTFLPTLTMGGYISGSSDDEADDYNNNGADDSVTASALLQNKPKSNRRGQRARRAIWEAKYGEQAKHLGPDGLAKAAKQQQHAQQNGKGAAGRDAGWDAKRGATDGSLRRFGSNGAAPGRGKRGRGGAGVGVGRGGRYAPGGGDYGREPGGVEAPKKRVKDDEGPLHPSWIAAKKAKEAKGLVNATFQGKKLTFD